MSDFGPLAGLLHRPAQDERFYGVTVGIVTNNQDPEKLGRVKLKLPWLSGTDESFWARVLAPGAGKERGFYALPEVDDEVLVAFEHGLVEFPYVLGGLWNGKDRPPETNADGKNNRRVIRSRSGHIIRLDDTSGGEKIEIIGTGGASSIVIDAAHNTITISADADVTIQAAKGKLKLSGKGVEITSQAEITLEAAAGMDLKASAQMKLKGTTIDIN